MSGLHNPHRGVYAFKEACRRAVTPAFFSALLCIQLIGVHTTWTFPPQDSSVNDIRLSQVLVPSAAVGGYVKLTPSQNGDVNHYVQQTNSISDTSSKIRKGTKQVIPYSAKPGKAKTIKSKRHGVKSGQAKAKAKDIKPRILVQTIFLPRSTTTFRYNGPAATTPTVMFRTACENSPLDIVCPATKTINILSAAYGRSDGTTCCPAGASPAQCPSTVLCLSTTSTNVVTTRCQTPPSSPTLCTVSAANGLFGDPCPGIYKYLTVSYTCL